MRQIKIKQELDAQETRTRGIRGSLSVDDGKESIKRGAGEVNSVI